MLAITISPSLALTALIGALETLIDHDNRGVKVDPCPSCEQRHYAVLKRYRTFLDKYGGVSDEQRKHFEGLYKIRSRILHAGELLLADLSPSLLAGNDGMRQTQQLWGLQQATRDLPCNWLMAQERA